MRSSKCINKIVDNEAYWTRVAAHLVWRSCPLMDLHPLDRGFEKLLPMQHNLYFMIGLDRGYYWSMERFVQRMEECVEFYSNSADLGSDQQWFLKLKPMSLAERTLARISERGGVTSAGAAMKEVAKSEYGKMMLYTNSGRSAEASACINKFMGEIEDDPIPAAHKRAIFKKLDSFLYELSEADHRNGVNYSFADHLANDVCKF